MPRLTRPRPIWPESAWTATPDPSLAELHRAHATTISFESFDPFAGRPVSLDVGDLEAKIVIRRRGGYCFEHNLLFAAALESLGGREADPDPGPRAPRARKGTPAPLNHLLLRVRDRDGSLWLADVGFGGGGLLDPVPSRSVASPSSLAGATGCARTAPELVLQTFAGRGLERHVRLRPRARTTHRHRGQQLVHGDPSRVALHQRTSWPDCARPSGA